MDRDAVSVSATHTGVFKRVKKNVTAVDGISFDVGSAWLLSGYLLYKRFENNGRKTGSLETM